MARDYEFRGPGVERPHPKKKWVNPDAHPVTGPQAGRAWGSSSTRGAQPRGAEPRDVEPRDTDPVGPGPSAGPRGAGRSGRSPVQLFAAGVGLVFLLVGIAGFIPGLTKPDDALESYGTESTAELFDLFRVSYLHNAVHLLFAVGLLAAASRAASKLYLLGGGVLYLGVAAYGFVIDQDSEANFLPINDADNLLHVGLSLLMILLGLVGTAAERRRS